MRALIALWLILLAGAGVALILQKDAGYVMLAAGPYTVELSLALLIVIIAALFTVLYLGIRLVARTLGLPSQVRSWQQRRASRKARRSTTRGLLEMAEGNWTTAEKHLVRNADSAETPLLNYLAAARAAQAGGADERRDSYIRLAHESMPSADVAVSLTQAELQLAHNQLEQALATLKHLRQIAPHHTYVLRLLKRLYEQLHDWEHLRELIPELRKRKIEDPDQLRALEIRVQRALLERASFTTDPRDLSVSWTAVPRTLRSEPLLLGDYAGYLIERDLHDDAEPMLRDALKHRYDDGLMDLYGQLVAPNPNRALSFAEGLLDAHPKNPTLLLALGRLALHAQLWGKARGYLEASIGAGGPPEAYRELGHLLEQLGEHLAALDVYRHGLAGTGGPEPVALPDSIRPKVNAPQLDDRVNPPPPHGARPPQDAPKPPSDH